MRLFSCSNCGQPVYFENKYCQSCGNKLGFDPLELSMVSLTTLKDGSLLEQASGKKYHYCSNYQYDVCNWVIPDTDPASFCIACSLNRVIPDLTNPKYHNSWAKIEVAKHRLIYALLQWNLPVHSKALHEDGLLFDFLPNPDNNAPRILTGHNNGLITINIAEADDVEREMAKNNMDEVYRTVLGHFRHEIGHYYWDLFIQNTTYLSEFRNLFGDETYDYQLALNRYYMEGPFVMWRDSYISAYASMHPW